MTDEQLNRFRTILEQKLEAVTNSHEEHRSSLSATQDRSDVESGDWSQELENVEVEEQVVNSEEFYIEKIRAALTRMDRGTYGICEGCGAEIPLARLEAKPSVSLCLNCQQEKEAA